MLVDTHSHLYEEIFTPDWNEVIVRCDESEVQRILLPNVDVTTIELLQKTVNHDPTRFIPMMGLHPCSVKEDYKKQLEQIKLTLFDGNYIAVGEIGIDLYWDKTFIEFQTQAFNEQVNWANELELPISIHSRESTSTIIDLLKNNPCNKRGVFHCFTGNLEEAREIIGMGYMLGIGGVVTFKNSHLPALLPEIGLEHLVLETDSPYLAPTPYRGKRNESSYTKLIALRLAEIFNVKFEEVANKTTANARSIFNLN